MANTDCFDIFKKLSCLLITYCNFFRVKLFLLLHGETIGNCFFFKKDNNTKMKKNASFFWFLLGKERGRIVPGRKTTQGVTCQLMHY